MLVLVPQTIQILLESMLEFLDNVQEFWLAPKDNNVSSLGCQSLSHAAILHVHTYFYIFLLFIFLTIESILPRKKSVPSGNQGCIMSIFVP